MLDLQRVAAIAGFGLLVFVACGDKFTAGDTETGGGSPGSAGDTEAGSAAGGEPGADGGVDPGGSANLAGKSNGGRGGALTVAGSAGRAGSGGKGGTGGSGAGGGSGGSGGSVVEEPPIPLAGLELWFDADQGVTLASNGTVTVWKDRSGHQRDAMQTAGNYRPQLDQTGLNGKATLVFDGVDDYLKLPELPGDFSHGLSIFVMAQQASDDGRCAGFFEASNGSEIDDVHLGFWEGLMQYEVSSDQLHPPDQPVLLGAPELLAVVHQTTLSMQMRRNTNGLGEGRFALPAVTPRSDVFIGRTDYASCKTFPGSISELVVYSRAVNDAELIAIEGYLQTKFDCCSE